MLHDTIIETIEDWDPVDGPLDWPADQFRRLAAELFTHQYRRIEPYRRLCDNRGVTPDDDPAPAEIPAVPTDAFKRVELFAGDEPIRTFKTSGTTGTDRGTHHFGTLDVYRASLHPPFVRFCNPDRQQLRFLVLAPPPADLSDSSLSFMLGDLVDRFGDDESDFFIRTDEAGDRLEADRLARALDTACDDDTPTLIFGTAFGFAESFERLNGDWSLPDDSRVVETGGFKGRHQQVSRADLYEAFTNRLGVESTRCLSEYSMTELSSQTYTDELVADEPTGRLYAPPWLKIDIVDPVDLTPVDDPEAEGLIRFFDLANVDSVSAVQTSDRGRLHPDGGLELLGRASGADLRGCSLTVEEIVG